MVAGRREGVSCWLRDATGQNTAAAASRGRAARQVAWAAELQHDRPALAALDQLNLSSHGPPAAFVVPGAPRASPARPVFLQSFGQRRAAAPQRRAAPAHPPPLAGASSSLRPEPARRALLTLACSCSSGKAADPLAYSLVCPCPVVDRRRHLDSQGLVVVHKPVGLVAQGGVDHARLKRGVRTGSPDLHWREVERETDSPRSQRLLPSAQIQEATLEQHFSELSRRLGLTPSSSSPGNGAPADDHGPHGIRPLHRLDKDVEGPLVLALTQARAKEVARQFQRHEVVKSACPPSTLGWVAPNPRRRRLTTSLCRLVAWLSILRAHQPLHSRL